MLSRIVIRGFKSFAAPLTLDLGPGVNVVVGPNGSGKSNLTEAVAWALGEQRPGRLRAPAMQEVLFSGGEGRPAAGVAEVVLTVAAAGDAGPAELEVGRRLSRAGDAGYRLNGAGCRLVDLQDALAGRGLGPDSLAIVRQGQVEAICASRPSERRAILDEAAGVGMPKRRRRRAEQKLARVGDRLVRARERSGDLAGRARALERQARAARRAAALEAEIAAARDALRGARAQRAAEALARAREAAAREGEVVRAAAQRLAAARAARAEAGAARARAGEDVSRAEAAALRLTAAAERIAARAELAEERLREARERSGRRTAAREGARARLGEVRAAADAAAARAREATRRAEVADAALRAAEAEEAQARAALRAARDGEVDAAGALAAARREAEDRERRRHAAHADLERARGRLAEVEGGAPGDADLPRAEARADVAARRGHRADERERSAEAAARDARAARSAGEERLRQAHARTSALAGEDALRSGPGPALGDGLQVEPGLERAVAAALGILLEARLAHDLPSARAALEDGATAAIVPAPERVAPPAPADARPLFDAVHAHDPAAPLARLLADAWLVPDLDAAPSGHAGTFVTAEGLALRPADGVVRRAPDGWTRRALHRRALEAEGAIRERVAALAEEARRADADHERLARRTRAARRSAAAAARRLEALRARAAGHAAALERARADVAHAEAAAARQGSGPGPVDVSSAVAAAEAAGRVRATASAHAERAAERLRGAADEARSARAAAAHAEAASDEAASRLGAAAAAAAGPASREPDLRAPARALDALLASAGALAPLAADAQSRLRDARGGLRAHEAGESAAHGAVEAAERDHAGAVARAHEAEVALALAAERAAEAGPVPTEDPPLDPAALEERLRELEGRRLALGAVNPLAAGERDELAEAEAEVRGQVEDLERASAALRGHLAELDGAIAEGFERVFATVAERFAEVVGLLFPGGEGRLRAVPGEDDEPGVEVEVVPAGKRSRPLSLLSGGERSLVALAFCLALAMARPSPFYLLDEVEAALDDVNLRRFLGAVRRLADRTQFVLITHQQPTVEIADTLFGVTMGRDGASQVLARRLARSVEGPARPFVRRALAGAPGSP